MAKYGGNSLAITIDNSGGTPVAMTAYITEINGIEIEGMTVESTPFGVTWAEELSTGLKRMQPITIKGFYDDTASSGPDAMFIGVGSSTTRTFLIGYGGTKTTSVETILKAYKRLPAVGELTRYEATFIPTGTVTEA